MGDVEGKNSKCDHSAIEDVWLVVSGTGIGIEGRRSLLK